MKFTRTVLVLALLGFAVTAAMAQTGGLTVQVVDDQGALPGATVTLSNDQGRIKTTSMITDAKGLVSFPVLMVGGGYRIEVSFAGLGTQVRQVHIKANQNIVETVQLAQMLEERVKVTAERELVDLDETESSTKFTDEFINDLPVAGRFYQNILTLAPGVNDADGDGNPNVHGSRSRDFKTMVGGVANVDPLTGRFASNVNPNSIEEMEVITAGAGPEYGRAQGGFANIIQKQGGNEFEGVFDFLFRSSAFDGDGATNLPAELVPSFEWVQPSLQVSGPIVKDRLWYRLSHEWIDIDNPVNTLGEIAVVNNKSQVNSDQITWQVSDRNKLAFKFDQNPLEITNLGVSSLTPTESSLRWDRTRDTYSIEWSAPYSPQIFVNSVVAWQDMGLEYGPMVDGQNNSCVTGLEFVEGARCFDATLGEVSGSFNQTWRDDRQRFTVKSDATIFARNKILGMNHTFKTGFIIENERYLRDHEIRPDMFFFQLTVDQDPTGSGSGDFEPIGIALLRFTIPDTERLRATAAVWGAYFRDTMKPMQNLSIDVGLRIEREIISSDGQLPFDPRDEFANYLDLLDQGLTPNQAVDNSFTGFEGTLSFKQQLGALLGLSTTQVGAFFGPATSRSDKLSRFRQRQDIDLRNTNISPFVAASWDPWSNGKTKFAFTWGRNYNNIPLTVVLSEGPRVFSSVALTAARRQNQWVVDDLGDVRGAINPAASMSQVDRNIKTPYQDELTVTFERSLWAESTIKLQYINRKFRDQLQDVDINHIPGDFGTCVTARAPQDDPIDFSTGPDGILDDCAGDILVPDNSGNAQAEADPLSPKGRIDRPDGLPDLYTMNPFWGQVFRIGNFNFADYEGVVVEFTRRQYRGWEMQGSYTYAVAEGNGEDFAQQLGDDQSLLVDEFGYQSYDVRHSVKLSATTITPWGSRLGGTVNWQTGLPYSLLTRTIAIDSLPPQLAGLNITEPRQRWIYETGSRNDQRNRPFWNFDVKATKEFNIGRRINMQVSAEIFNLLNDGTYTVYNNGLEIGRQINGFNEAFRRFGRRFQLGMKLSF